MKKEFVVAVFIFNKERVLLVKHKRLKRWLPVGGHIDLGEIPEEAVSREIKEETGLDDFEFMEKPDTRGDDDSVKVLVPPNHIQLENIDDEHQHIDFVYFCRAVSDDIQLAPKEHDEIKWFSKKELASPEITKNVRHFAKQAIKEGGKL